MVIIETESEQYRTVKRGLAVRSMCLICIDRKGVELAESKLVSVLWWDRCF